MEKFSFFTAHIAGGDYSEERAADREDDGENPVFVGAAKSRVPGLPFGVSIEDDQWFVKKKLFAFSDADSMFLFVLEAVSVVPIEAG